MFTFQGVFSDWSLKLIEWFPPENDPREPMTPIEFLDISVISDKEENTKCKFSLAHCGWNSVESESRLKKEEKRLQSWEKTRWGVFVEPRIEKGKDFSITFEGAFHLSKHPEDTTCRIYFPSLYQVGLNYFPVNYEHFSPESIMHIENYDTKSSKDQLKGIGIDLKFLNIKKLCPDLDTKERPIKPGIFKGTYGSHGMEMIEIDYKGEKFLTAVKLTSSVSNVPENKITFTADLLKSIILTKDQQTELNCSALEKETYFAYFPFELNSMENQEAKQPFVLPPGIFNPLTDVWIDANAQYPNGTEGPKLGFEKCLWRFLGEGQIANVDFDEPQRILVHVVIFNEDCFAVLYLRYNTLCIYSRVKENFKAVGYKDI